MTMNVNIDMTLDMLNILKDSAVAVDNDPKKLYLMI